jgi:hypothetical protein
MLSSAGSPPQKNSDDYLDIGKLMNLPLLNLPLICTHLELRTDPAQVPNFKLPSQKYKGKNLLTKKSRAKYLIPKKNGAHFSKE